MARDGEVGAIHDVFFDDWSWVVRYLVVKTGPWLQSRQVLIAPLSCQAVSVKENAVRTALTRERIEACPEVDTAKPISRQYEIEFARHYALPRYWAGGGIWGEKPSPSERDLRLGPGLPDAKRGPEKGLRSGHEVRGYHFEGQDGELGHIKDLVLDDEQWWIRYIEIDTRNWWPGGKKVLLARQWIDRVSWNERKVKAAVHRNTVKEAPPYDEAQPITPVYEVELFKHYGKEVHSEP